MIAMDYQVGRTKRQQHAHGWMEYTVDSLIFASLARPTSSFASVTSGILSSYMGIIFCLFYFRKLKDNSETEIIEYIEIIMLFSNLIIRLSIMFTI